MDTDFSGGRNKKIVIEPLNDIATPKLPNFAAATETLSGDDVPVQTVAPEIVGTQIMPDRLNEVASSPDNTTSESPEQITDTSEKVAPPTPETKPSAIKTAKRKVFFPRWTLSKRWTILIGALTATLICGGAAAAYLAQPRNQGGTVTSTKPAYTPKITTVASNLSGLQVEPDVNKRPVTGVMIENSEDARPQSGLGQASIVFEAIAEGGITRFLALFQDTAPDYIGPVRSARPYYVQWCMSFDCALAHAGGSPEALTNIKSWGTKDLDQFANGGSYQRVTNRYAPHNLYTSTNSLNQLESTKGYTESSFSSLSRKKDAASKTPNATSIDVSISGADFNSHYDYDATTNSYKRSQAGAPHMTVAGSGTQAQITPKTVVVLVTSYGIASDKHSQYGVTGSGEALVFQDGIVTHGSWHKDDYKSAFSLQNDSGGALTLNAGQTWFVALPGTNKVSYH